MGYWPLSAAFLVVVGVAVVIQPTQIDLNRDGMIVVRPVGKRYYPATELAVQEDSKRVTITRHSKRRAVLTLVKRPSHLRRKYRWQPSHVQNPAETVRALLHHDQEASGA